MPRIDDFKKSFEISAEELARRNPTDVARRAGAEHDPQAGVIRLDYYSRPVEVGLDPVEVRATDDGPELPLQEQALVLHYLVRADGTPLSGQWITFREVESGEFYWSAFVKRAIDPLVGFFGTRPQLLAELAPRVGGRPTQGPADINLEVRAMPRVKLLIQLWEADEEFPAQGNVLFDASIGHYLSTEAVALVAGLPIYKMMAMARSR